MRSLALALPLLAVLTCPATAVAQTPIPSKLDMPVLSVRNGVTAQLAGKTRSIASGFLFFALVLGLLLEAFGDISRPRDYGAVVWRAVIVFFLIVPVFGGKSSYGMIFGTVISTADSLAARISPPDAWETFGLSVANYLEDKYNDKPGSAQGGNGSPESFSRQVEQAFTRGASLMKWGTDYAGGFIFGALLTLAILICQAIHWLIGTLGSIITALFYVLGPLALVASVPRNSSVGSRWFASFCTVAIWPVITALLLAITTTIGIKSFAVSGPFGSLCAAFLMAAVALATPRIASAIVGGAIGDIVSPGVQTLAQTTSAVANVGSSFHSAVPDHAAMPPAAPAEAGSSGSSSRTAPSSSTAAGAIASNPAAPFPSSTPAAADSGAPAANAPVSPSYAPSGSAPASSPPPSTGSTHQAAGSTSPASPSASPPASSPSPNAGTPHQNAGPAAPNSPEAKPPSKRNQPAARPHAPDTAPGAIAVNKPR